jgi:uncharacterized protein YfdQ (DUF2303 family)
MTDTPDTGPDQDPSAEDTGPSVMFGIHEAGVHGSVIQQTAAFVERYSRPDILSVTEPGTGLEAHVVVTKHGVEALPESFFDQYRDKPKHRCGTAVLLSLDSFIAHVNRFKDEDSAVFANNDRAKPSMTAVLDYNRVGATADPRFGAHRSSFAFPLSDEWKAWVAKNGQAMKMKDFALFLEDRIIDVMPTAAVNLTPDAQRYVEALGGRARIGDPSTLMQIATELRVMENSVLREAKNLSSGETKLEFSSEHDTQIGGVQLTLPTMFVVAIPVFANGDPYQIIARFRYRKAGAEVVFWYDLWRTDTVFDHAFDEAVSKVGEDTGLPVLLGAPENQVNVGHGALTGFAPTHSRTS